MVERAVFLRLALSNQIQQLTTSYQMASDKATLSVLNTFADLLDGSGDGTVSPAVLGT